MNIINRIRFPVENVGQLRGLRIVSIIICILFAWGLMKDLSAGGKYFQSTFYTDGLYFFDLAYQVVGTFLFFWFGTLGFKVSTKSRNDKTNEDRHD